MKRPFLTTGITMLLTVHLTFQLGTRWAFLPGVLLLAGAAALVFFLRREARLLLVIGLASLCAASCVQYTNDCKIEPALAYCGKNIEVTGTVTGTTDYNGFSYRYVLSDCTFAGAQTSVKLRYAADAPLPCVPGDTLRFRATEICPIAEKDNTFYYAGLARRVYIFAYSDIAVVEEGKSGILHKIASLRETALAVIRQRLPAETAAVLGGLTLGNTDLLPPETERDFCIAGLAHLFAVSGFHVALWSGLVLGLFGSRRNRLLPSLFAAVFVLFFMALTGFSASVCRSGLMLLVVYIGNSCRRDADSFNSLGLALTVLLTINPYAAASASLLLSAGACAALLLSSRPTEEFILTPVCKKIPHTALKAVVRYALGTVCVSVAVLTALLPLLAYYFGYLTMLAPLSNFLCALPAETAMVTGMTAVLLHRIPYLSDFLFHVTEQLLRYLLSVTEGIAALPFAAYPLRPLATLIWYLLSASALGAVACLRRGNRKLLFSVAVGALCVLLLVGNIDFRLTRNHVTLTVTDAGNASCITVCDRAGNAAVIGAGGDYLTPYYVESTLRQNGAVRTRLLLVPDVTPTEAGCAKELVARLKPEVVVACSGTEQGLGGASRVLTLDAGDIELWEGVRLQFERREDFRAAVLTVGEQKAVLCFYPSSDFTTAPAQYRSADLLVCRQAVPPTAEPTAYGEILLSGSKPLEAYKYDYAIRSKARTTADYGSIERIFTKKVTANADSGGRGLPQSIEKEYPDGAYLPVRRGLVSQGFLPA